MVTRGNFFGVVIITTMNRFKFKKQRFTIIKNMLRKRTIHSFFFGKCFPFIYMISKFNKNLCLPSFNNKIWQDLIKNIFKSIRCHLPSINMFTTIFGQLRRFVIGYSSSAFSKYPINQNFVCRTHLNSTLIVRNFMFVLIRCLTSMHKQRTFSVKNSSYVSSFRYGQNPFIFVLRQSRHNNSLINSNCTLYQKQKRPATTNRSDMEKIHEVIVWTVSKDSEGRLKCHPRHKNVVSIREEKVTDRTLINEDPKRRYGVSKPTLIDLEGYSYALAA